MIENNGKKLYWDWEHRMRTSCTARRPDLTLEDRIEKKIMIIDMACPNESNKEKKREEKVTSSCVTKYGKDGTDIK